MSRPAPGQRRLAGWSLVGAINLLVLFGLFFGLTEWFIARKARTTLVYRPSHRLHHELLPDQRYERDGFPTGSDRTDSGASPRRSAS